MKKNKSGNQQEKEVIHHSKYDWRKLKVASEKTGHEVKKVFDANFGAVNAYHEDAWKEVYLEIYDEIMKQ